MRVMTNLVVALVLAGCATADEMYMPDGRLGYNISCDGAAQSMGDRMEKASELCGARGYDIYNSDGQAVPFTYNAGYGYSATVDAVVTRNLMVACR